MELIFIAFFLLPLSLLVLHLALNWRNLTFSFSVTHLLIVTAFIASVLVIFGMLGIAMIVVSLIGGAAISCAKTRHGCHMLLAGTLMSTVTTSFLLVIIPPARQAARRMSSSGNLKQIALAMHNYHDTYKVFPPAYLADEHGAPKHSWRVLVLPFLEERPLFDKYDFNEPWDGPNNRQLLSLMPSVYQSKSVTSELEFGEFRTPYVAIVDPEGAMRGSQGLRWSDFDFDRAKSTILAIEAPKNYPLWMAPTDLETPEAIQLYIENYPGTSGGHRVQGLFKDEMAGWYAAMVDGSVLWIRWDTPQEVWQALINRNDIKIDPDELPMSGGRQTIYSSRAVALWVLLVTYFYVLRTGWVTARTRLGTR